MKAVVCTEYGPPDNLQIKEINKPVPAENELLIKIHASTVNRTDCAYIRAIPFFARLVTGLFKPKRIVTGTEFAGAIEAVGKDVTTHRPGDRVFGFADLDCGCHAQYMTITADKGVAMIPQNIDYKTAAASSEGAHYAINFINKVDLKKEHHVLINGTTGAIGSAALQLVKYYGATVTAVCNTQNVALVKSLGADRVIDYLKEDFIKDDQKYHYIFDCVGKSTFFHCRHLLHPRGIYISSDLGPWGQNLFLPLITPLFRGKKTVFPTPIRLKESIHLVKKLSEKDKFNPVIDREYPMNQIIKAFKYVEQGGKTGNVVINIEHPAG